MIFIILSELDNCFLQDVLQVWNFCEHQVLRFLVVGVGKIWQNSDQHQLLGAQGRQDVAAQAMFAMKSALGELATGRHPASETRMPFAELYAETGFDEHYRWEDRRQLRATLNIYMIYMYWPRWLFSPSMRQNRSIIFQAFWLGFHVRSLWCISECWAQAPPV